MKRILVIGAGTFGGLAVDRLEQTDPSAAIDLVDQNSSALKRFENRSIRTICQDGVSFLCEQMEEGTPLDWIVPAIPRHVAYEWIRVSSGKRFMIEPIMVPESVYGMLPNPIRGASGEAYLSNADFICPNDCAEPETLCTCTGKPRPRILHKYTAVITYHDFRSIVIVSRQLAPGVGGYPPAALRNAQATVEAFAKPVLLTTACKCHGVMHAFRIDAK
jgi:hypothetical protein